MTCRLEEKTMCGEKSKLEAASFSAMIVAENEAVCALHQVMLHDRSGSHNITAEAANATYKKTFSKWVNAYSEWSDSVPPLQARTA